MAMIQARINEQEKDLINNYSKMKNISVSELIRKAVFEKIEDDIDLALYDKAMNAYNENPITYTHSEVLKELG